MRRRANQTTIRPGSQPARQRTHRCGLCGRAGGLARTECCKRWVCGHQIRDGRHFAPSPCYQKHERFTLCGFHWAEQHDGSWQECERCRREFPTEMYVYNFEPLKNPPTFEPTHCAKCGVVISLSRDGHTRSGGEYWCAACADAEFRERQGDARRRPSERDPRRQ